MIPIRTLLTAVTLVTADGVAAGQAERIRALSNGERLFELCSGCHSVDASDRRVGPSLKGLFHKHELANGTPANDEVSGTRSGMAAMECLRMSGSSRRRSLTI